MEPLTKGEDCESGRIENEKEKEMQKPARVTAGANEEKEDCNCGTTERYS